MPVEYEAENDDSDDDDDDDGGGRAAGKTKPVSKNLELHQLRALEQLLVDACHLALLLCRLDLLLLLLLRAQRLNDLVGRRPPSGPPR